MASKAPLRLLNALFPSFQDSKRVKPRDMELVAEEDPGLVRGLVTGAQHALVMLMVVVYVVIVGAELGLSDGQLRGFVALQVIVLGVTTLLQGMRTRFSSGHQLIHTPSIISSTVFIAVVAQYGFGAAAGAFIVSGLVVILLARAMPKLQKVFPPEVTGVLLVLLGMELIEGGVSRFVGLDEMHRLSGKSSLVALVTLGGIVGLSIWGGKNLRIFAVGFGVVAGLVAASMFGMFGREQFEVVSAQPFVALPFSEYSIPRPRFIAAAIAPLLLIEVISAVDSIGMGVAVDRMNNGKWKRPDFPMIGRLINCHGIGVLLNGICGTLSSGVSSSNLGLTHATGIGSRKVAVYAGGFLILAALLPQVSALITQVPQPIRGAIIIYTAGYMLVSGMQLILSRMLNNRRMFMIGLSLCVGGSIILMPELASNAPDWIRPVIASGLTMGTVCAIILNQLFRIGISQSGEIALSGSGAAGQAAEFLEDCGASWGARPDVITRANSAFGEAWEALYSAGLMKGAAILRASFDEYTVVMNLSYSGEPIALEEAPVLDLKKLIEEEGEDDAIDVAMGNLSGNLIRALADKATSSVSGGKASLRLDFEH